MPKRKSIWSNPVFLGIFLGVLLLVMVGGIVYAHFSPVSWQGTGKDALAYNTFGSNDLGMVLLEITGEQAMNQYRVAKEGVYVLSVLEGSPAQLAGVQSGDLIVMVNDASADTMTQLDTVFAALDYQAEITLTVLRNNEPLCLTVNSMETDK